MSGAWRSLIARVIWENTFLLERLITINGNSLEDIKKFLETTFKKPISKSDKFLINDVMSYMCPEFDNRKIFEK